MENILLTEAEWDTILASIAALARQETSIIEAYEYARQLEKVMKDSEDLTDVEAFDKAFGKGPVFDRTAIQPKVKEINERSLLLASKVISLRNYFQSRKDALAVDDLIKNS